MALMIATAMQALDTTIANVALPQLEQSLGGGIELGSWLMTSYLCASAIIATLTGWLRRRYGARVGHVDRVRRAVDVEIETEAEEMLMIRRIHVRRDEMAE